MSDVTTAAESMGIPAELVSRSAAARAQASGSTTEEVLAAWSGGGSVATRTPDAEGGAAEDTAPQDTDAADTEAAPAEEAAPPPPPSREPAEQAPLEIPAAAGSPTPAPAPARPATPPVLVGTSDNPLAYVVGAVGLFVAVALLALVGPSIPVDAPGARTSEISFSDAASAGQDVYLDLACASCHTQMVRPVLADVGLGPVTMSDSNQILGTRRYGPDLSDVGSRVTATQLESIIVGSGGHQGHNLSSDDLANLVAYLLESSTTMGGQ
ncbi:MAG: cbb3-type cytochrome c oxidase subunit II [Acidimicrobiia bacterium]